MRCISQTTTHLRLFRVLSCLLSVLSHINFSAALPHGTNKNSNLAQYSNSNALIFIFIRFNRNRTDNYICYIYICGDLFISTYTQDWITMQRLRVYDRVYAMASK